MIKLYLEQNMTEISSLSQQINKLYKTNYNKYIVPAIEEYKNTTKRNAILYKPLSIYRETLYKLHHVINIKLNSMYQKSLTPNTNSNAIKNDSEFIKEMTQLIKSTDYQINYLKKLYNKFNCQNRNILIQTIISEMINVELNFFRMGRLFSKYKVDQNLNNYKQNFDNMIRNKLGNCRDEYLFTIENDTINKTSECYGYSEEDAVPYDSVNHSDYINKFKKNK